MALPEMAKTNLKEGDNNHKEKWFTIKVIKTTEVERRRKVLTGEKNWKKEQKNEMRKL